MKRILAIIAALAVSLAASAYAGQFGPMDGDQADGQTTLGVGYTYHPAKYKMTGDSFVRVRVNADTYETALWSPASVKTTQHLAYVQATYKNRSWLVYGRLGGASMKIDDAFMFDNPADFKGGFKAFATVGIRGTYPVSSVFSVGPFFEASLFSGYDDNDSRAYTGDFNADGTADTLLVNERIETENIKDLKLGLSFQANLDRATLYAGPFLYWTEAKAKENVDAVLVDGVSGLPTDSISASASSKWDEKGNLGGFAGVRVPLGQNFMFEAEGQLKSMISVGGSLSYKF
jgi:hypothetical protein